MGLITERSEDMWKKRNDRKKEETSPTPDASDEQHSEAFEELRKDVMENRVKTVKVYAGY